MALEYFDNMIDGSDIMFINKAILTLRPNSSWSMTAEGKITEWSDAAGTDEPTQAEIDADRGPRVTEVAEHVLGHHFNTQGTEFNVQAPGAKAVSLHTDPWWLPPPPR